MAPRETQPCKLNEVDMRNTELYKLQIITL